MINYKKGDLLEASEDCIAHGANCRKTMGSGVAKALRAKWPEVYAADYDFNDFKGRDRIGSFSTVKVDGKQVYNIYTQVDYLPRNMDHFQYEGFKIGLAKVFLDMKAHGLKTLALPKIGAGLAGGDWTKIEAIIKEVSDAAGVDVTIYEL